MPVGASIFLGVVLVGFAAVDIVMLVTLSMPVNPFIHLEVIAILYFCALMYNKKKHGG